MGWGKETWAGERENKRNQFVFVQAWIQYCVVGGKECTVFFLFNAYASCTCRKYIQYLQYISIFTRSEYGYREPSNTTSGGFPCAGL
jgi:hypothetical protein